MLNRAVRESLGRRGFQGAGALLAVLRCRFASEDGQTECLFFERSARSGIGRGRSAPRIASSSSGRSSVRTGSGRAVPDRIGRAAATERIARRRFERASGRAADSGWRTARFCAKARSANASAHPARTAESPALAREAARTDPSREHRRDIGQPGAGHHGGAAFRVAPIPTSIGWLQRRASLHAATARAFLPQIDKVAWQLCWIQPTPYRSSFR